MAGFGTLAPSGMSLEDDLMRRYPLPSDAAPPASDEPDWSRMNQPFGMISDPRGAVIAGAGQPWEMREGDVNNAINLGMGFSGGGLATKDPTLWHTIEGGGRGVTTLKLRRPLSEIPRSILQTSPGPSPERLISPEDIYGHALIPVPGDRTGAGYAITHVGETPLSQPIQLGGGHGFMYTDPRDVWASKQGPMTGLSGDVRRISEQTGKPVSLVYGAMGPQAVDFSTFMSDALVDQLRNNPPTEQGIKDFNSLMRNGNKSFDKIPDFPGIESPNLHDWLHNHPVGAVRDTFAKHMDKLDFQKQGFPNVGETRHAVIDPRLMNTQLLGSGLSIARADPFGTLAPSIHPTYETGMRGSYTGSLGRSLPFQEMFPDMYRSYQESYPTTRFDKLVPGRVGPVKYQEANQQWLDNIMRVWQAQHGQ